MAEVRIWMFNADGYLSVGLHEMEIEEIEETFVDQFESSATRKDIFTGYVNLSEIFAELDLDYAQLIGGSYVTSKLDPNDLDLVSVVDKEVIDSLTQDQQLIFKAYVSGPKTKDVCLCDSYYVPSVPEDHPDREGMGQLMSYWVGLLGHDRDGAPKGIVFNEVTSTGTNDEDS